MLRKGARPGRLASPNPKESAIIGWGVRRWQAAPIRPVAVGDRRCSEGEDWAKSIGRGCENSQRRAAKTAVLTGPLDRARGSRPQSLGKRRRNDGGDPRNYPAPAEESAVRKKLAYFAAWHTICLDNGKTTMKRERRSLVARPAAFGIRPPGMPASGSHACHPREDLKLGRVGVGAGLPGIEDANFAPPSEGPFQTGGHAAMGKERLKTCRLNDLPIVPER